MAILSTTHIHINGNELPYYSSCSLHQEIGKHHTMDLHCLLETIQRFCTANNQEIEELLGAIITIETKSYADIGFHGMLKFKGIITGLSYRKGLYSNDGDYVIIKAKSPTIIADDGSHHTSYSEMSFVDIIEQNFNNYDTSKLKINTNNSKLTEPLTYTVQANESCFAFAQRMAARHGEWLYYNGEALVFGLESGGDPLDLILGRDLQDFNTSLSPVPQKFNYFTNDYLTDDVHETASSSTASASEGHFSIVNDNSNEIYTNPTKIWVNQSDDKNAKNRLDNYAELQQKALQTNQVKVSGTSDNPGVMLASAIKISQAEYRVTKVTHSYSSNGEYENFFEATSTNVDAYPNTDVLAFPKSDTQTAIVMDNTDPEGLGRIKVQFPWQKSLGETTPWLRIVTPHAGGDKGFHFIPEIDEEVLIGFEGRHAEQPYMMGSLYNGGGKPESWKTSLNDIKAIRTRSGHTIELNDTSNGESITITDKKGNHFIIDTAGESISINALKDISINAGENINITAGKNISISAGENMDETAGQNVSIIANKDMLLNASGNMTEIAENRKDLIDGDFSRQSTTSDEYANEMTLFSAEENMTIQSSKTININSAEKSKLF